MTGLRALVLLTVDLLRRLLREPSIVRSLMFPAAISGVVVTMTVATVVLLRPPGVLVLPPDLPAETLVTQVEERGWHVRRVADPEAVVREGEALVGTDGQQIWTWMAGTDALRLEAVVRKHLGAGWYLAPTGRSVQIERAQRGARHLVQFIGALFAFYGVVFGAGSVARDRDHGTFEAEMATAVPMWVHGAARWLAGSLALGLFYTFSVLLFYALMGAYSPEELIVHGFASAFTSVAIGLLVIGRAGLERGFAAPMSIGLVIVTALLSYGFTQTGVDRTIPVASVLSSGDPGWRALAASLAFGSVAVAVFTRRSTVQ